MRLTFSPLPPATGAAWLAASSHGLKWPPVDVVRGRVFGCSCVYGGYAGFPIAGTIRVLDSAPDYSGPDRDAAGWRVRVRNDYGNSYAFTVYVLCAY